jgi:hypothetical protein
VVGFTIGSRGKVPGKSVKREEEEIIIIIIIIITTPWHGLIIKRHLIVFHVAG